MKLPEIMTDKLVTGHPDEGVREAFFKMRYNHIRHLPVVDEDMGLLGIVTDRDLRRPDWVDEAPDLAHVYYLDDNMALKNVMTRNPVVVHTYDPVQRAAQLMRENRFGALPVLNKEQRLVGMVSAVDMLQILEELLDKFGSPEGVG
ncbi:MAG: CBS domain-containing protein [Halorhodospira halophila]|uniref:CBS domain-containing protein n=1 Tax=Halorhodospira TaxID=85108 RepID=UPI0019138F2E|nr:MULTISPECIES: CBS domain-containing protein [Halorhodospira]MBK5937512.1 histidine kinase [Halorhodospira halophila]MBK5942507.1 histidine kinase [Halorhodospira halophila]MCC3751011.1 CBS domain-containing protein [Halorhodospira halophila]MCG5528288.1 CBS domain-containing protein [Halorhodospira halophila]MCG5532057.1 CBS domain-containing protein [Halorhodospira sp. 9621]